MPTTGGVFDSQSHALARRLLQHVTLQSAPAGAILCTAGAPADHVLLIVNGVVEPPTRVGYTHAR